MWLWGILDYWNTLKEAQPISDEIYKLKARHSLLNKDMAAWKNNIIECQKIIDLYNQESHATELLIKEQREAETIHCNKVAVCEILLGVKNKHIDTLTKESVE